MLKALKLQILRSLRFAEYWLPNDVETSADLWHLLKSNTTYIADPKGVELLQTFQTLMEGGYHGIKGGGDCDCLTIAVCSCAQVLGWPFVVVLAGNGANPTHIFPKIKAPNEDWVFMDLTEGYNQLRTYRNYEQIKMKL